MITTTQYKTAPLFGGAIVADLPSTYEDVSTIRQVPDNQEVYLDKNGFGSIAFDLLERVEGGKSDAEALKYHLSDIVDEDAGQTRVWGEVEELKVAKMPGVKALGLLATSPPGEKMRGRKNEPEFVAILLVLVRLERVGTDVVVAVNVPHLDGEGQQVDLEKVKEGGLIERAREARERVLSSFEVREWGLFGSE